MCQLATHIHKETHTYIICVASSVTAKKETYKYKVDFLFRVVNIDMCVYVIIISLPLSLSLSFTKKT